MKKKISSPNNRMIINEQRKNGGQTQFKTDVDGEYRFCFDNSFSRFAEKQVFFYIASVDPYDDPNFETKPQFVQNDQIKDNLGEMENKIENIKQSFSKVNSNLERAQHIQNIFKAYEMIDRGLMEESFERVNFWSVVNIIVLVMVGMLQVYMIRSLFEDKSAIGRVLRK
jgi:protein ERP2